MWRAMVMGACLAIWTLAAQAEEQNVLNVYNWSHYIGQRTLQRFERETGIKVRYDVYDSNEILQGKLLTGRSGYDVVGPSMSFLGNQLAAGAFQPLDKSKLPNYRQLDPALLRRLAAADPGNRHAVPYLWGTSSVAIDEDRVRRALGGQPLPADALALLFDPAYAAKLSGCGIAMMISPSQVVVQALIYLGKAGLEPAGRLTRRRRPAARGAAACAGVHFRAHQRFGQRRGLRGDDLFRRRLHRRASRERGQESAQDPLPAVVQGRSCGWTPSPSPRTRRIRTMRIASSIS